MKLSVSLPAQDIEFLDAYVNARRLSRSAGLSAAVALLRSSQLQDDYVAAWDEWSKSEDAQSWDRASADGL